MLRRIPTPARRPLILAFALWFIAAAFVDAQPRFRPPPNRATPARLDEAGGRALLERFRFSGIEEPFFFQFRLRHMPRRAPSITYEGRMWAHWWGEAHRTRIRLSEDAEPLLDLLLVNGASPEAWMKAESSASGSALITGDQLLQPLAPGLAFTPFELLMPFVHWEDWAYEGSDRLRGRPAHYFLLYPPEDDARYASISGVRILIDEDFNVLLQAEILGASGELVKTMRADTFRRMGDQWIVRRIDITNEGTRDRTRFEVIAAAMEIDLPDAVFDPEEMSSDPGPPPASKFEAL